MKEELKPNAEEVSGFQPDLPVESTGPVAPGPETKEVPKNIVATFDELLEKAKEGATRVRLWDHDIGKETNPHNGKEYWALVDSLNSFFDAHIYKITPRDGGTIEIDIRHPTETEPRNPNRRYWIRTIGLNRENFADWKIELI